MALAAALGGCSDPPDPPPAPSPSGIPRFSTAAYVRWAGPGDPVSRPLAVFVDVPGGDLDQLVADPDVTTFLNDRFHAWFLTPEAAEGLPTAPAAWFVDGEGCLLGGPERPAGPASWIAAANTAVAAPPEDRHPAPRLSFVSFGLEVPALHPLRGLCQTERSRSEP